MAYEPLEPTLIENTTMEKYINSQGVFKAYRITPNEGYVLHDNTLDRETDGVLKLGYSAGTVSCGYNYDFTTNSREFYAVLADSVASDQICTVPDNDHEVMDNNTNTETT